MKKLSLMLAVILTVIAVKGDISVSADSENVQKVTIANPVCSDTVTWDCVYYGKYPQSDASGVKKDKIRWRVLSVEGDKALLISDLNLDVMPYKNSFANTTWENSDLRQWLNESFLNAAFSAGEQSYIEETVCNADANSLYSTSVGNTTEDKITLLSEAQAKNAAYGFTNDVNADDSRIRRNTAYVAAGGSMGANATPYEEGRADLWWLRTPGDKAYTAEYILYDGQIVRKGDLVSSSNCMICPVMVLDLNSPYWKYAGTVNSDGVYTTVPVDINGYQISYTAQGMRIVYTAESSYRGLDVVETGLVYGLADGVEDDELYVGSDNSYVYSYNGTSSGVLNSKLSFSDTATSYAMTMTFAVGNRIEHTTEYIVRAYILLEDGTYIYSDCVEFTNYLIADYLYKNRLMGNGKGHDYLYNSILKTVDDNYKEVIYNEN